MTPLVPLTTTGIGSLPHRSVEAALDQAFRMDLPYLPQLPLRDPREFMLAQAVEGVPGLLFDEQGMVTVDLEVWRKSAAQYDQRLMHALEADQLKGFLPSASHLASFEPFLGRIKDQKRPAAKIQIAGPMTVQWTLRTTENRIPPPAVLTQLTRTILARASAMVDAVKAVGAEPVIFIDEPGLYAFSRTQPNHIAMLQELRVHIMALKKRGARVGLHCCSDADWTSLLGLGLDLLAIDTTLSLRSLLKAGDALVTWAGGGGRLALGVIPTDRQRTEEGSVEDLFGEMQRQLSTLEQYFPARASIFRQIFGRSMVTPACGLAFLSEDNAAEVVQRLDGFRSLYRSSR